MAGYPPDYSNSGFRYFSKPFNTQHAVQSFNLQWDPSLVWYNGEKLSTGGWKPLTAGPVAITGGSINIGNNVTIGNTVTTNSNITNTAPISVSGVVTATGTITVHPITATVVNNSTPSGSPAPWTSMTAFNTGVVLGSNAGRTLVFIQNIHSGIPLYVALNGNAAHTGNFNFILNPSLTTNYGGSSWADDHYRGPVTVSGGAWMAWEL